jgi:hypothetical protein
LHGGILPAAPSPLFLRHLGEGIQRLGTSGSHLLKIRIALPLYVQGIG